MSHNYSSKKEICIAEKLLVFHMEPVVKMAEVIAVSKLPPCVG
jgi:hypothetical protein